MNKFAKILSSVLLTGSLFFITGCNTDNKLPGTDRPIRPDDTRPERTDINPDKPDVNPDRPDVNPDDSYQKDEQYQIYELAVREGRFHGTYDEWLQTIKGEPGMSAYELYKKNHPEYTKSEREWLDDLVNGTLGVKATHKITFDSNGGSPVQDQEVKHLEKVKKAESKKEGYKLDGWFIGDEQWVFSGYNVTDDIKLVAHWSPMEYNIELNFDNGEKGQTIVAKHDDQLDLAAPKKDGYVFNGWRDQFGELYTEPILVNKDLKLTAVYSNTVYINFDTNGGMELNKQSVTINENLTHLPTPKKDGATFVGWYYNDGTKDMEVKLPFKCSFDEDITLKAHWQMVAQDFNYILSNDEVEITEYIGKSSDVVLPGSIDGKNVTRLNAKAFQNNSNITSITIGDNVTYIENGAFNGCTNLLEVNFNSVIKSYPQNAFVGCNKLETLGVANNTSLLVLFDYDEANIPETLVNLNIIKEVRDDKYDYSNFKIKDKLFNGIKYTKYNIGFIGEWDYIFDSMFEGTEIVSVDLPYGVTDIANSAFADCINLQKITIPDSVTTIGWGAFRNNRHLYDVKLSSKLSNIEPCAFEYCTNLRYLLIPNSVRFIGGSCFAECNNLSYLTLSKNLQRLDNDVFRSCNSITKIYFEGTKEQWFTLPKGTNDTILSECDVELDSKVTAFETKQDGQFEYIMNDINDDVVITRLINKNSNDIDLSNACSGLNIIGLSNDLFKDNRIIESVVLPSKLTKISSYMFNNCTNLKTINIPNSVEIIGAYAFSECRNLTGVELPTSVKHIETWAFNNCNSINSIYIPKTVEVIDYYAFANCYSLIKNCEVASKPEGWNEQWHGNYSSNINWGVIRG